MRAGGRCQVASRAPSVRARSSSERSSFAPRPASRRPGDGRRRALDSDVRYHVLACDYDGTTATDGRIEPATAQALRRLRDSGRKLVLVTGRVLEDLERVCPELDLFDRVVAENGAVLYT